MYCQAWTPYKHRKAWLLLATQLVKLEVKGGGKKETPTRPVDGGHF